VNMSIDFRPSIFRRLWVVVLMTVLLLPMPLAMVLILSGPIFRKSAEGWRPISNRARLIYGCVLVLWLVAAAVRAFLAAGGVSGEWASSADPDVPKPGQATMESSQKAAPPPPAAQTRTQETDGRLPLCDSQQVIDAVKDIIENGAASKLLSIKVEDFGQASETIFDQTKSMRRCHALAVLNTGDTQVTYQVFLGPSGKQMVQAQTGEEADQQYVFDSSLKEDQDATARALARERAQQQQQQSDTEGNSNKANDNEP